MARTKLEGRIRRKRRIRKSLSGTAETPRLSVFKSDRHILGQVIDDVARKTIVSASSHEKALKKTKGIAKVEGAKKVGALIAERALSKGIKKVVFDRNGFAYHGRIKAFADAAREKGLAF
jgi:large subunit ribosomal protein L18